MDVHTFVDVYTHAHIDTYSYSDSHCYIIADPGPANEYPQAWATESSGTYESASRESGSYKSCSHKCTASYKSTAGDSAFAHHPPNPMNVLYHIDTNGSENELSMNFNAYGFRKERPR
jgi:hypothetical protein